MDVEKAYVEYEKHIKTNQPEREMRLTLEELSTILNGVNFTSSKCKNNGYLLGEHTTLEPGVVEFTAGPHEDSIKINGNNKVALINVGSKSNELGEPEPYYTIDMYEITEKGFYRLYLDTRNYDKDYYNVDSQKKKFYHNKVTQFLPAEKMIEYVKNREPHLTESQLYARLIEVIESYLRVTPYTISMLNSSATNIEIPSSDLEEQDLLVLFNKIYTSGLQETFTNTETVYKATEQELLDTNTKSR